MRKITEVGNLYIFIPDYFTHKIVICVHLFYCEATARNPRTNFQKNIGSRLEVTLQPLVHELLRYFSTYIAYCGAGFLFCCCILYMAMISRRQSIHENVHLENNSYSE